MRKRYQFNLKEIPNSNPHANLFKKMLDKGSDDWQQMKIDSSTPILPIGSIVNFEKVGVVFRIANYEQVHNEDNHTLIIHLSLFEVSVVEDEDRSEELAYWFENEWIN